MVLLEPSLSDIEAVITFVAIAVPQMSVCIRAISSFVAEKIIVGVIVKKGVAIAHENESSAVTR